MYENTDSYWILTYTNFWYNMVGKDHFVLHNTAFCRVGGFFIDKTKTLPFSTSVLILLGSMVLMALKKTSRGKFMSLGLLGACVAFSFLG